LCGFTIKNGLANNGGGICILASSPVISHCIISENSVYSPGHGEAIYVIWGMPLIEYNMITLNDSLHSVYGVCCIETEFIQISNNQFVDEDIKFYGNINILVYEI